MAKVTHKQTEPSCGAWKLLVDNDQVCDRKNCRLWQDYPEDRNCANVTVYEHGPLTLAETAKRMGLSLSRVKQLEQAALEKLKKRKIFDF
tara:strand:+ start:186 stop:455 length:270 start_codon:yes stop_codon:yes gene_type:complete